MADVTPNFKVKPIRLNHSEMAKLRELVFLRDKYTCQLQKFAPGLKCVAALNAHHVKYRSQGGDDSANNLLTVCTICHTLVHKEIWACDVLAINGQGKRDLIDPSLTEIDVAYSLFYACKQKLLM